MTDMRIAAGAAAFLVCAALSGCSPYGPKGDRGLPPPPENVAYPRIGDAPPAAGRPLKSREDQRRLEADLLARKKQPR